MGHRPFLYYWLNGRFLNVLEFLIPGVSNWRKLVALRLLSTIYSAITVVFCYLLSKEIFENRWWQLLPAFLLINTLMFVFLSGGVNYDNLVNLCTCAGIYFLVRVIRGKSFYENSMLWLIFIFAGALTEGKALPLAFITSVIWLMYVVRNHQQITLPPRSTWLLTGLTVIFIAILSLNLSIWGVNLIRYHALTPPCNKILTQDQCNLSPFVARAQQLNLPEKLTLSDVVKKGYPGPLEYAWDYWTLTMPALIYGILGHRNYFPGLIITCYRVLLIWVVFTAIRYWKKPSYEIGSLIAILGFHSIVLLWVNYNSELTTGFKHIAIQGRYMFPVIGAAYVLTVYCISQFRNIILRSITVFYTVLLFLWGSPLLLLINLPPTLNSWFN
jgi:hypothetical protein